MWWRIASGALTVLVAITACSTGGSSDPAPSTLATPLSETTTTTLATQPVYSLAFTLETDRRLDVFSPREPGPWPVVLILPGTGVNRTSYGFLARMIARGGTVVFNVGVDMADPFNEATEQVACAVRYASVHADDYGGDGNDLTLVGHSAGAATGMVAALTGDEYAHDCTVNGEASRVGAVVLYEGPYDWGSVRYQTNLVRLETEAPEAWRAINPYVHLDDNPELVVRLIHGDDSGTAWYEFPRTVSSGFNQALYDAGYDTELILVDDADHNDMTVPGTAVVKVIVEQAVTLARG